jgi:hypothetical protein
MSKTLGLASVGLMAVAGAFGLSEAAIAGTDKLELTCGALGFSIAPQQVEQFARGEELSGSGKAVLRSVSRCSRISEEDLRGLLNRTFSVNRPRNEDGYEQVVQYGEQFAPWIQNGCSQPVDHACHSGKKAMVRGAIAFVIYGDESPNTAQASQFTLASMVTALGRRGTPAVRIDVPEMVRSLRG